MFSRLIKDKEQRDMLLQIARFGVSGVLLTAMVGVLYTFGVYSLHLIPTIKTKQIKSKEFDCTQI